jgi:hypothetical protein
LQACAMARGLLRIACFRAVVGRSNPTSYNVGSWHLAETSERIVVQGDENGTTQFRLFFTLATISITFVGFQTVHQVVCLNWRPSDRSVALARRLGSQRSAVKFKGFFNQCWFKNNI